MTGNPIWRPIRFVQQDLWTVDFASQPPGRKLAIGFLRVLVHVCRSFSQNMVGLSAAGLTLVALLALVPMLALVFSIGKALGYAARLEDWLAELASSLPVDARGAVEQVQAMVTDIDFKTLGALGSVIVVWSGFTLFLRIEQALNSIWRVRHSRPWLRRVSDFIALIVLVPPLAVVALLGASLFADARWVESVSSVPGLGWLHGHGVRAAPYLMLWVAFSALYKLMPSARVRWRSALCGGAVAGTALVLLHGLYLDCQVGVAQANAIYATLAALPLLLIYMQLLWTVVLVGGEVSFAVQNVGSLHGGERLPPPTFGVQKRVMWHLMREAAEAFRAGRQGVVLSALATRFDLPRPWIDDLADLLVEAELLVPVRGELERLMPARPPETISMSDLVAVLDRCADPLAERVSLSRGVEQRLAAAFDAASRELSGLAF